jgi:hypothetical protein
MAVNQFQTGTPEEYIKAGTAIDQVCKDQGIDKDPTQKNVMPRRILMGEALPHSTMQQPMSIQRLTCLTKAQKPWTTMRRFP